MLRVLPLLAVLFGVSSAFAQSAVLQGGGFTQGHLPQYVSTFGQPIIMDGGGAGGGALGVNPGEIGITARGAGTPPFSGLGTGPLGSIFTLYDAPTTNATGYHYMAFSPNSTTGGPTITVGAGGTATALPFTFVVNGTNYAFPFVTGGIVGPGTTVVNDLACWNNTVGTLLKDCGTQLAIGGSSGQIQYNNSGALGGFTVSGDGTLNTGTGALAISKIGGVSVSLGGTLTTAGAVTHAGAFAQTLTATGATNVTLPTTGTLATLAGSEALTGKTYNGLTISTSTGTLAITNGKTLTAANTLTLTATDGSTLAVGTGGTLGTAAYTATSAYVPSGVQVTNSLSGDVNLNNTGTYFDGPSIAQGSTGTWYCSGTVSVIDTAGGASYSAKLWDGGANVAASGLTITTATNQTTVIALSGYVAAPAGNMRISVKDGTSTSGLIKFNASGNSKDGTLSCFRVQ